MQLRFVQSSANAPQKRNMPNPTWAGFHFLPLRTLVSTLFLIGVASEAYRLDILRKLWKRWDARLCLVAIVVYCALALCGEAVYRVAKFRDVTPAYNTVHESFRYVSPGPSWHQLLLRWEGDKAAVAAAEPFYPLGSDNLGRDVASRCVQGARLAFH